MPVALLVALATVLSILASCAGAQPSGDASPTQRPELQAGDPAPDFALKQLGADKIVKLSDLRDTKPVVLVFASYT